MARALCRDVNRSTAARKLLAGLSEQLLEAHRTRDTSASESSELLTDVRTSGSLPAALA